MSQTQTKTTKIKVGKSRLSRTIFNEDAVVMRVYMDEDMFNQIAANGHYSGMTADEYVRTIMSDHLKQA